MSMRLREIKYLILVQEDLLNIIEEKVLRIKIISNIYQFFFKDAVCCYSCIKKITIDRNKLNTKEVRIFFDRMEISTFFNNII